VFIGGLAVGAVGVGAVIVLIRRRKAQSTRRRLNAARPATCSARPASDFAGENPVALLNPHSTLPPDVFPVAPPRRPDLGPQLKAGGIIPSPQLHDRAGPRQLPPTGGAIPNPLGALPVSAAVSTHGGQLQQGGLGREERASFAAVAAAWRPDAVGMLPHASPRVAETQVPSAGHV